MLTFLLLISTAFASSDSVGVFHRPDKVLVLVNESGSQSRLQQLMNAWGVGADLLWQSSDGSVWVSCGRNAAAASCTFRILPSPEHVRIDAKEAFFDVELGSSPLGDFATSFESSNGQLFQLRSLNGHLYGHTLKR